LKAARLHDKGRMGRREGGGVDALGERIPGLAQPLETGANRRLELPIRAGVALPRRHGDDE
jgi:hypothetical protein